ncbi:MAG: hypothetical protein MUF72_14700 [Elainella sp. Prado103]|jgi:hypothetical protein|nr:hypothetical protein [Elainella sp. Prado103]
MLIFVLVLNLSIASLCWYGVWRIWQLRRALVGVTQALTTAEYSVNQALQSAPELWLAGQVNVQHWHHQYELALLRLQQVRQILTLLGLGQFVWRRYADRNASQSRSPQMSKRPDRSSLQKLRLSRSR